jgi:hypothetical protein
MQVTTSTVQGRRRPLARLHGYLVALAALDPERLTAAERLEQLLGRDLARLLLRAHAPRGGSETAAA